MSVMTPTQPVSDELPGDDECHDAPAGRTGWRAAFLDELARTAARGRWGRALMISGWVHLAALASSQAIYRPEVDRDFRHVVLWLFDLGATLGVFRVVCGRGWYRASPAAALIVRVWGTFFILAFNLLMSNLLTGWSIHWFRLAWTTLSSFGFAAMAWIVSLWFLVPAVQMYLTGLLMIQLTHWNYLIYGVSWWAALQGIGLALELLRVRDERSRASQPRYG